MSKLESYIQSTHLLGPTNAGINDFDDTFDISEIDVEFDWRLNEEEEVEIYNITRLDIREEIEITAEGLEHLREQALELIDDLDSSLDDLTDEYLEEDVDFIDDEDL